MSGRATESPGTCNDSPSSWEVDSAPNLTLDLPYRRSPPPPTTPTTPPLTRGEVERWLQRTRLLDLSTVMDIVTTPDKQAKEVKKNTKEIIQLVDSGETDKCIRFIVEWINVSRQIFPIPFSYWINYKKAMWFYIFAFQYISLTIYSTLIYPIMERVSYFGWWL